jgi:hypothetical protein
MNQWHFVIAAYAVVLCATALLVVVSWSVMRRAEATAEALRKR